MRRTVSTKPLYLHAGLVVFACLILAHLAPAQEKKEIRIIPTNKDWTHTGIQATPGQTYKVTVRGRFLQWRSRQNGCIKLAECRSTAEGLPCPGGRADLYKAPRLPCFSLIGRIGSGEPFLVGNNPTISAPADALGELQLAVNDNYYDDNSKGWWVTITSAAVPITVTYFIGGFFDATYHPVESYYNNPLPVGSKYTSWSKTPNSYYRSWNPESESAIIREVASLPDGTVINLVGHSLGGHTAAKIAIASGKRVNLLITVDPVTGLEAEYPQADKRDMPDARKRYKSIRAHSGTWCDINATGGGFLEGGNEFAFWAKWGNGPEHYATQYTPEDVSHASFSDMMKAPLRDGTTPEQLLLGFIH